MIEISKKGDAFRQCKVVDILWDHEQKIENLIKGNNMKKEYVSQLEYNNLIDKKDDIMYIIVKDDFDLKEEYIKIMAKYSDCLTDYNELAKKVIIFQEKDINFGKIQISITEHHQVTIEYDMILGNMNRIMISKDNEEIEKMRMVAIARINAIARFKTYYNNIPF